MKLPYTRVVCAGDSLTYGVYLKGKGKAEPDGETYPSELFRQLAADRR